MDFDKRDILYIISRLLLQFLSGGTFFPAYFTSTEIIASKLKLDQNLKIHF